MGRVPFPEIHDEGASTDRPIPAPKIDIRRASAPHSQLPTVEEVEDDHYYHLHASGRRSSEATEVAPIGFERLIRSDSIARLSIPRPPTQSNRDLSSSMSSDMPFTPVQHNASAPLGLNPSSPSGVGSYGSGQGHLHTRASDSSLSITSSAGAGSSPKRNDTSTHSLEIPQAYGFSNTNTNHTHTPHQGRRHLSSPSSNDAGSSASWGSRSPSGSAVGPTTSATVEFSSGRSIWC